MRLHQVGRHPDVEIAHFNVDEFRVGVRLRDGQAAFVRGHPGDTEALLEFLRRAPPLGQPDEVPLNLTRDARGTLPALQGAAASFMVAQTCNLRCVYCFAGEGDYGERATMPWSEAKRAVDALLEAPVGSQPVQINFFGGEPMLAWPLIERTVLYANETAVVAGRRVEYSMTTNATRVTAERADFLARHGFTVLVSIDGTERDHNAARPDAAGRGSWSAVVAGAKLLLSSLGPERVSARATLRRGHAPYEETIGTLKEIGFSDVHLCVEGASVHSLAMHSGSDSPWRRRAERADLVAQSYSAADLVSGSENIGDDPLYEIVQAVLEGSFLARPCGVGDSAAAIGADGTVYPCHRFVGERGFALGSLSGGGDAGGTTRFLELYKAVQNECQGCMARRFCAGGCVHEAQTRVAAGSAVHDADECESVRGTVLAAFRAILRHVDEKAGLEPTSLDRRALGREFRAEAFRQKASATASRASRP